MNIDIGALQLSSIDIGALQGQPLGQLFVSNNRSILTSDLNGSNPSIIINDGDDGLRLVGAYYIDIDTINQKLFFMILGFPSLCRMSNLDGTSLENVAIDTGSSFSLVPSIAIDNSSDVITTNNGDTIIGPRIFIADNSNNRIGVGSIVKKRILGSNDFVTSIAINSFINTVASPIVLKYDSQNNVLFWTESNETINKTDINGNPQRLDIIGNSFSLAIDPIRRKLYYAGTDRIEGVLQEGIIQCDYNGSGLSLIQTSVPGDKSKFFGLGIDTYSNNLYWQINSENKLYYKNIPSDDDGIAILDENDGIDRQIDVAVNLFESSVIQSKSRQKALFINGKQGAVEGISTPPPLPPPSTPISPPFIGSPPSPPGPPIEEEDTDIVTSLSLFLDVPESCINSIEFFIGSPQIENYLNLYIGGPIESIGLIDFFVKVIEGENNTLDLFLHGADNINNDILLFIYGRENITNSIELFIKGSDSFSNYADLFIEGEETSFNGLDFYILGKDNETNSIDLLIRGVVTEPGFISSHSSTELVEHEYSLEEPISIIGDFDSDMMVTISIWINNEPQTIISNICNEISDTGKYAWSISNIPVLFKDKVQYHFRMIDDVLNTVDGDFILFSKEAIDGSMPSLTRKDTYISSI